MRHLSTPRQQPLVAPRVAVAFDGGGLRGRHQRLRGEVDGGSKEDRQRKNWPGPAQFGGENSHKHVEFTWIGRCTEGVKIVVVMMMMMMMMIGNHIYYTVYGSKLLCTILGRKNVHCYSGDNRRVPGFWPHDHVCTIGWSSPWRKISFLAVGIPSEAGKYWKMDEHRGIYPTIRPHW